MDLSTVHQDALIELINIGFGRAGAALSKLTGHRVQLEVPEITMCPIDEMADRLRTMLDNEVATVHQIFSGQVDGDALLVLDRNSAAILKELLTSETPLPLEIDRSAREVLTEIGNILLNACLGTFGNILKVKVSFSVPHLTLDTLESVVRSISAFMLPSPREQPHRVSRDRSGRGLDRTPDPRPGAVGRGAALTT